MHITQAAQAVVYAAKASAWKSFFVEWFRSHGRSLPWRDEQVSPYGIMVTEMLLRQTRAQAVAEVWDKFMRAYPTAEVLAAANPLELREHIEVLGFGTQRSQALRAAAGALVERHKGSVPYRLHELIALPHVGLYTARAVQCFAFGARVEIVDVNVLRLLSRFTGMSVKADIRRNPHVWALARRWLPKSKDLAPEHNYGLLDFSAEVCRASRPQCGQCALRTLCCFGCRTAGVPARPVTQAPLARSLL